MNSAFEEKTLTFTADVVVERGCEIDLDFMISQMANQIRMHCQCVVGNPQVTITTKGEA